MTATTGTPRTALIEPRPSSGFENGALLFDAQSLLYRAYFAIPPTITTPDGRVANGVYGFLSMALRALKDFRPRLLAIAFDSKWPTNRHGLLPSYKGNRKPLPIELLDQVGMLQTFSTLAGIPWYAAPGYEADDILATLSSHLRDPDLRIVVATGDRDLFQLTSDQRVAVLFPKRGTSNAALITADSLPDLVGVTADCYIAYRALIGDPSDNIKGVPGIGPKLAAKIVASVPSVLEALRTDDWGTLPPSLTAKLHSARDVIARNIQLLTLDNSAPIMAPTPNAELPILAEYAFTAFGFAVLYERYSSYRRSSR